MSLWQSVELLSAIELMLLKCELMLLKSKIKTKQSANIVLGNGLFKIIETKYEYFNTLSKHFVGCKNPFYLIFVLI